VAALACALASATPAASASAACAAFTTYGVGYRAQRIGSVARHLASCLEVRAMVRRWARRGYPNTGPAVYALWTCSFDDFVHGRPGRQRGQSRRASCFAGLNGFVHFRLTAD